MKIKKPWFFWSGIIITALLGLSFFIQIETRVSYDQIEVTSLLGILIFYNPFVLTIYVLVILYLFYKSLGKKIKLI